ncbi:MAG: hypothetical protein Q9187_002819 [Circinaria calcarea]
MDRPEVFDRASRSNLDDISWETGKITRGIPGGEFPDAHGEFFVYDRKLLTTDRSEAQKQNLPRTPVPPPFNPKQPPDSLTDENSLGSWQKLFKDRRAWAIELSKGCDQMIQVARTNDKEASTVQRATALTVENVKQHVGKFHRRYEEANTWARGFLQEHAPLLDHYEMSLHNLSSIPAHGEFERFLRGVSASPPELKKVGKRANLQDFVNVAAVRESASIAQEVYERLTKQVSELTENFEDIIRESSNLIDNFNDEFAPLIGDVRDSSTHLNEEIEVMVKKIGSDYESSLGVQSTPKSISTISRTAALHTRNFLPSLQELSLEVDQLRRQTVDRKNRVVEAAFAHMQKTSGIESSLANMQAQLAALDIGTEGSMAFDMIKYIFNLPSLYGSILVEAIHRCEWSEKLITDSSTLAEEMAIYKDEEERRRRRWQKSMGDYLNHEMVDGKASGVEINLKEHENIWPSVTREDANNLITSLRNLRDFEEVLKEMDESMKSLDAPTKQQSRRSKAFKNGSIHDVGFGKNSLILRPNDDLVRALQSDKAKLEDRLKGSESRVRKLEDLLHRQSQMSNPPNIYPFGSSNGPILERHATSPVINHNTPSSKAQDNISRQSSVSSRRFSANNGLEEKALAQRIVQLEADLIAERTKAAELQTAAVDKVDKDAELQRQMQDAVSTKRDLMENLEAQQHEFDDERRLLEEETGKLKLKLEEVEDELDRVLGSRDNEKMMVDERVGSLEAEVQKVRRDAAEEVQKAQGQIEFLKHDYILQREKANQLERQIQKQDEEKQALLAAVTEWKTKVQNQDDLQVDHGRTLRAVHLQLATNERAPDSFDALVDAVEVLAERSAGHLGEVKQALDTLRNDNVGLQNQTRKQTDQIRDLTDKLGHEEMEVFSVREDMAAQKSLFNALQAELDDERGELASLRKKFAAGETGAEVLRSRIAEEELKVESLSGRLASATKLIERLETELSDRSNQIWTLQSTLEVTNSKLETRGQRAKEISRQLISQTNRLSRLLEHVGFAVTKQENGMVIQRVSRAASASTTLGELSQSMNRSLSGPLPTTNTLEDYAMPSYLDWATTSDAEDQGRKYDEFVKDIQGFRMDAFSEAIIKRIKESEHVARKWQREAKSYREKAHRAQVEAHEKIAFRSFKEGDLALFLPTRNQATKPWAAFNVGAPHYFLREQDSHKLRARDWLLARISKVEERIVDLSKPINGVHPASDRRSIGETSDGGASFDDENPFELSDGLRWYMLDAAEEKPGAPTTPGLGKSTVASANVDAKGSIQRNKRSSIDNAATKTLTKSLDSRRSSTNSKKGLGGLVRNVSKTSIPEADAPALGDIGNDQHLPINETKGEVATAPATESAAAASGNPDAEQATAYKPPVGTAGAPSPQRSPEKPRPKAWESLYSLDLNFESGKGKK